MASKHEVAMYVLSILLNINKQIASSTKITVANNCAKTLLVNVP